MSPTYLLMVAAQIGFIIHAARTGRPYYWMMILLFIPFFGIIAYIVVELLPAAGRSRAAGETVRHAKKIIDPQATYRQLADRLELTPTADNKRALADECVRLGKLDEAEDLYRSALTGLHATDPNLMLGLARVRFERDDAAGCLDTLAALKEANPDFQNPDGHMLYARSLEATGETEQALAEYRALVGYFGGEEPRVRLALLLQKTGDRDAARDLFLEVKKSFSRGSSFYQRNQREWYKLAEQNLKS